jgi:vacuolar protein sorting-associated protein 54
MDDRLKAHAKSFDKIDWETVPEGKQVHTYAETIVSETSTLHNVLRRYLSPMLVEMILDGVFASYISRLTDEYTKIERMTPAVKKTMLADATYITDNLSQLPGVRKMDRGLIQAVEAREVVSESSVNKVTLENGTSTKTAKEDDVLFDASKADGNKQDKDKEKDKDEDEKKDAK